MDTSTYNENTPIEFGKYICTGVFLFLTISGFLYFFDPLLRDILAQTNIAHKWTFVSIELFALAFTIISLIIFNKILRGSNNITTLLKALILLYMITQVFQFSYPFVQDEMWESTNIEKIRQFIDWKYKAHSFLIYESVIEYLREAFFVIFLIKLKPNIKTHSTSS